MKIDKTFWTYGKKSQGRFAALCDEYNVKMTTFSLPNKIKVTSSWSGNLVKTTPMNLHERHGEKERKRERGRERERERERKKERERVRERQRERERE